MNLLKRIDFEDYTEEEVSIEEIRFFKQVIKEIIDKRRDKYSSENL